jgi:hypothetical protein
MKILIGHLADFLIKIEIFKFEKDLIDPTISINDDEILIEFATQDHRLGFMFDADKGEHGWWYVSRAITDGRSGPMCNDGWKFIETVVEHFKK